MNDHPYHPQDDVVRDLIGFRDRIGVLVFAVILVEFLIVAAVLVL